MHFSTKTFATAVLFSLLAGRVAATPFTQINTPVSVANDYASVVRSNVPGNWNGTTQLLSLGEIYDTSNSVRDFQYTGTTRFSLDSITFTGHADYGAPDARYATAQQDLAVQLVTNGLSGQRQQFLNLSDKADGAKTNPFPLTGGGIPIAKTFTFAPVNGSKVLGSGSTFSFLFYESYHNSLSRSPDAYYDAPFTITFNGTALIPKLSVVPATLIFTGRAGTGPVANQSTVIANTGVGGSLLVGNAGPATGPFSGGNQGFSLEKTDATHPGQSVSYGFAALASTGGSTTAVLSQESVQITSTDGGNQTLTLNGNTVGPVLQMTDSSGNVVADGGILVDFGQVRQGTSVSTAANPVSPKVSNIFGQDLGNLTTLTLASTVSGNGFSFAPGLSGTTVAGDNHSVKADVVFDTAGFSDGQRTQVLGIGTDQDAALGATGAGTQFGYQVMGTVVGPDGTATDVASVFDFSDSNVTVQSGGVRTGVIDLGDTMPWTAADLMIHNQLSGCDSSPSRNDALCGITIGAIAWEDLPATPLTGLNILLSEFFEVNRITRPDANVLSAGSDDTLDIRVAFNSAGLMPGTYGRTLVINTDVGAAFGDTTAGRQYRFQFTASVGETPEPATLLLLGSTLGLLMGARKRRHTRERDDSISGS